MKRERIFALAIPISIVAGQRAETTRKSSWVWVAALVTALVPAVAYANFVLNHFYVQGAYFLDSGVVAGAIWRRDAWLTYAPLWPVGSLYGYHVMPLLTLLTLASRYLPIGLPGWFALMNLNPAVGSTIRPIEVVRHNLR